MNSTEAVARHFIGDSAVVDSLRIRQMLRRRSKRRSFALARRSGITLIHTISLMIVIGVLMSLSVALVRQAFLLHSRALQSVVQTQAREQLFARFRKDAHEAQQVEADEQLRFSLGQKTILYQVTDDRVRRTMLLEDRETGSEEWHFPYRIRSSWEVKREGALPRIEWHIDRSPSQSETNTPAQDMRWSARVGVFSEALTKERSEMPSQTEANTASERN